MTRRINLFLLAAIFVIVWVEVPCEGFGATRNDFFPLIAIPLAFGTLGTNFIGTVNALLFRGRTLFRPSLDRFWLTRDSPLQFFWFGGWMFWAAGVGQMVGCGSIDSDGLMIAANGVGLVLGSEIIVRIFSRRFTPVAN